MTLFLQLSQAAMLCSWTLMMTLLLQHSWTVMIKTCHRQVVETHADLSDEIARIRACTHHSEFGIEIVGLKELARTRSAAVRPEKYLSTTNLRLRRFYDVQLASRSLLQEYVTSTVLAGEFHEH